MPEKLPKVEWCILTTNDLISTLNKQFNYKTDAERVVGLEKYSGGWHIIYTRPAPAEEEKIEEK